MLLKLLALNNDSNSKGFFLKIAKWVRFANDGVVSVLLLPCNGIFVAYITISLLSLVHDEGSEKIILFKICRDGVGESPSTFYYV